MNVVLGDACEPWVLEEAQMAQAEVVVAATGDDEDNLVTSLLAKQEFAVPRVLARVNHPKNEWLFNEQWGVDAAVSPPHILTAMVEEAVTVGDLVRLIRLEGGRRLDRGDDAARRLALGRARPIYELRLPRRRRRSSRILREGHVVIPQPETVLAAGDEVVALASAPSERALRDAVVGAGMPGGVPNDTIDGASGGRLAPDVARSATAGRVPAAARAGSRTPRGCGAPTR